jgi:ribosomal protein S18 acetylase RimI-like enzyme
MTLHQSIHQDANLAGLLTIRPLTIDELAQARTLHAEAFRFSARTVLPDAEFAAALSRIATPEFTDSLAETAMFGGFMDDSLVATAGWSPIADQSGAAQISAVAVAPIFTDTGIGRRMVAEVEARAGGEGFTRFHVRAQPHVVPFFLRIGYDVVQQGLKPTDLEPAIPVMTMRKILPNVRF